MGLGLACMAIIVSDIIITSTVLTSTKMKEGGGGAFLPFCL